MENDFFSYPKKGDSLFREIARDRHNVCLDPYISLGPLGDNWFKYIAGYKNAADILVESIIDDRSNPDFIAFPIIYLYRHFIELSLKLIIRYGYQLFDNQKDHRKGRDGHDIIKLWGYCREIIKRRYPNEEYETLDATESIIKEFAIIDLKSSETRYPERKDGNLTMEGINYINLKNLKEVMEKINNFLGSICEAISIELSEYYYNSD